MISIVIAIVCCVMLGVVFYPKLRRAALWRAMITPLASIIGSGFLISGPLLTSVFGGWAVFAMGGLCALAFLYGSAIRFSMQVEAQTGPAQGVVEGVERASDFVLSLAYFISVAYYLNLFAAFGLKGLGVIDPLWIRAVSSAVIMGLGLIGFLGGLKALEELEVFSVGVKLAIIAAVLVGLIVAQLVDHDGGQAVSFELENKIEDLRIVLGLLILVQGFETSKYLGSAYSVDQRVKTMRWAQGLSTLIYLGFIGLGAVYFQGDLPSQGAETVIIERLGVLSPIVPALLIMAALASQSSAAVADLNGAGGLIYETSKKRISVAWGNLLTAGLALVLTWVADIFEIITYASKAFVLYYALQALRAVIEAYQARRWGHVALYGLGVLIAGVILVWAQPAEV
ncbi:hypothetical protein [Woodsholea maritima]|uniref:hypothetical protein n=1 Tax=Woodsholea maritima TaxID=240237 RepID=UPI00036644A4|nr:hypothetical protein [Woodsholea maritima]